MPYVKFTGNYGSFITGRDVAHAVRYEDASDETCIGFVDEARAGETIIEEGEYDTLKATIAAYNATIPEPVVEPAVDPQHELLLALATEWEAAAAELKAGRNTTAADALQRAGAVARNAMRG